MFDDFTQSINQYWTQTSIGGGKLRIVDSALRMEFPSAQSEQYVDAQIDDYSRLARSAFPWRPPLRMEVRARSSLPAAVANSTVEIARILRGTAGFGFWHYTRARFWVDDILVLIVPEPPTRPLGFVAWLDNQYAVATPRGTIRFGFVASGPQWFEIDSVRIEHF